MIPQKKLIITIDGPAGSGKSTISKIIAQKLNYKYIDTGALYRGIALAAKIYEIDPNDDIKLENLCDTIDLKYVINEKGSRLFLNKDDITDKIRMPEISMIASLVSAKTVVRNFLLKIQRKMGEEKEVVFEGRDMGTVVFPNAEIKFFLVGKQEVRAQRRFREQALKSSQTIEDVERDMKVRDENDSKRVLAPLKPAPDAIMIDSTNLSIDEVVEKILSYVRKLFSQN